MKIVKNLSELSAKFEKKIHKIKWFATNDKRFASQYCLIAISQLNNFLRYYLLSIRNGAYDKSGNYITYPANYPAQNDLIDDIMRHGFYAKWRRATPPTRWHEKDEPAYHTPQIFSKIVNGLRPSNLQTINSEMTDSWKIDVLRAIRNYHAHRCHSTESEAISNYCNRYASQNCRASHIIFINDSNIGKSMIEDVSDYLVEFSRNIT